ncbi:MAG: phosphatidylserine decarboxylase [Verrucomicrobiota bacterium]|nr:phosphatidylserine decarboxylase [Verrucomicrobiota bacterium]
MRNASEATRAALRVIYWTLVFILALMLAGALAKLLGPLIVRVAGGLMVLWLVFALFTIYFFRDPEPAVPSTPQAIVSPASGKVDLVDEVEEPEFMGGRCRRISVFMSVFDVHVQRSPVAGRLVFSKRTPGSYMNAMRADSAAHNENVLLGFESFEQPGERVGIRLIAGLVARRIAVWVQPFGKVARGERISLIHFGSRVDLYLPMNVRVLVKVGDHVTAGATVVAERSSVRV